MARPTYLDAEQIPATPSAGRHAVRLPIRAPYEFGGLLAFLGGRAIPGVETVSAEHYERSFMIDGAAGAFAVRLDAGGDHLLCDIEITASTQLAPAVERIRQLFDTDADPAVIADCLGRDAVLRPLVDARPGLRVPGAWDSFELAVRAIVGQQVSVVGATTVMGRISATYGEATDAGGWRFPSPERLTRLETIDMPMPRARAEAIRGLAQAVVDGAVDLSSGADSETLNASLQAIKGIGPWTANYVCMRALGDPDAFLHSDLVLLKVARAHLGVETPAALLARSRAWQPWRAYAGMHLWQLASKAGG